MNVLVLVPNFPQVVDKNNQLSCQVVISLNGGQKTEMLKKVTSVSSFPIIIEHRKSSVFEINDLNVVLTDCADAFGRSYIVEIPKFVGSQTPSGSQPMKSNPFNITHQNIYFSTNATLINSSFELNSIKFVSPVVIRSGDSHQNNQRIPSQQDYLLRNRMGLVIFIWAVVTFHRATLAGYKSFLKMFA
jgi:hypothetical protein